jgi:uncharacterized membrane protein YgaE (UPF0421/DUF939 family)
MVFRLPSVNETLFMFKMLATMLCAYFASKALGLSSPMWAAATAVIIAGETPGASILAGLSRLLGTVIGLAAGLFMHAFFTHPLMLATTGFLAAYLVCQVLGLKRETKMAGISSLLPTLVVQGTELEPSVVMAAYRATNILLGGVIGVVLSFLLMPSRAADRLRVRIREQAAHLGQLVSDIIDGYANGSMNSVDLHRRQQFHAEARELRRGLYKETGAELTDASVRRQLHAQIRAMEQLSSATDALLLSVERFLEKPGPALSPNDFRELAAAIVRCTRNWDGPGWHDACEALVVADAKCSTKSGIFGTILPTTFNP